MSVITDNASEIDPDLRGSVDFDFFSSPRKGQSPEKMTNGDRNGDTKYVDNSVPNQKGKQHGGHGDSDNDSYSDSDSFSDSGSCTTGCSQRTWSHTHGHGRSRSPSRSPSPSPRPRDEKKSSENLNVAVPGHDKTVTADVDEVSHHSRSRHSSYSSRSRSRSRSSSYESNRRSRSDRTQSKESLKIQLPDAEDEEQKGSVHREQRSRSYSDSYSESDSDMTDVSPLNSRETSPAGSPRVKLGESYTKEKRARGRPPRSPMQSKDKNVKDIGDGKTFDREQIDLNLLMQAVMELDQDRLRSGSSDKKVMFIPPHIRKKIEKNYSFGNDKISDIDRENQRLLQEIMRQTKGKSRRKLSGPPSNQRMSHSAVNRRKEQQRVEEENMSRPSSSYINRRKQMEKIETENMKILRRLQEVRPSKGLSRNDQLKDYTRQVTYGVPTQTLNRSLGYARSTTSWDEDEVPSLEDYERSPSQKTRPVSAKVRPQSGKVRPQSGKSLRPVSAKVKGDRRPAWDDRW